jgi:hypothetical protein
MRQAAEEQEAIDEEEYRRKEAINAASFAAIESASDIYLNVLERQKEREVQLAGSNAEKIAEINRKYGEKQKKWSETMAIIKGALAVVQIWAQDSSFSWYEKLAQSIIVAAEVASEVSIIQSQKFARGGAGVLGGKVHASGGVPIPGIGVAEAGEHFSITSRAMTSKYGGRTLDAISNSINQGKFFEVWGNTARTLTDPYTKKMYELMLNTPTIYSDSHGNTVKQYPDGRVYVIKRVWLN